MAELKRSWRVFISWIVMIVAYTFLLASVFVSADQSLKLEEVSTSRYSNATQQVELEYFRDVRSLLRKSGYRHVWPEMKFGWRIIVGSIIGSIGAAFGSVGGGGGGRIYVPMLTLVIGFDAKSSISISKCMDRMVMGAALSTVFYNLKQRHPTLDMPIIDYSLTVLILPMLLLGISIGVILSEIFADWMLTVLLIVLFLANSTSTMSFFKGLETWKKETILKKEASKRLESNGIGDEELLEDNPLPIGSSHGTNETEKKTVVPCLKNVHWKELGILLFVWVAFLVLQILKNKRTTCSTSYWVLSSLQIPVSVGFTMYEAVGLYKGKKVIASIGEAGTDWKLHRLIFYRFLGVLAGLVGGLLGVGGGFILSILFLELGIPPQVSSATANFANTFSSSMSVVEFYLLKRFPVPYALYFLAVATLSALVGQHVVRKIIIILGRASLIIFILAITIFTSAILLGAVGITDMVKKIEHKDYMGFENFCSYDT